MQLPVPLMEVTIQRAATILRISPSTIRRQISEGALKAQERRTEQGLTWFVDLPEQGGADLPVTSLVKADRHQDQHGSGDESSGKLVAGLRRQVRFQTELLAAKDRQIRQLQVLLQQATLASSGRFRWPFWQ